MIDQVIPCTKKFTRETLLGRLEVEKMSLKNSRDFPRVEFFFSTLSVCLSLSRSVSTSGDYARRNKSRSQEYKRIEEGISLFVRRELGSKIIFECWACNEFGHYTSKFPKREKKYKKNFMSIRPRDFLYANEDDEYKERVQSESDDELGFVYIKEEN